MATDTAQHPSSSLSQPGITSFLAAGCGLMKAPVQEVEGGLQDIRVSRAALPTQLAHCKSPQEPCHLALQRFHVHQHS